ncbi:putative phosphoglucomutase [Gordonia hirsuta DSM 44140 = NBRC 16056]|uniref:Putative phosphoglucomutase n=1 Tax=Gordonia hirsuta DSM 44140 = NBRC 16056 TaxID=1121927 RepID=L7L5W3_9ACTN|nr:phospho-sugar mutase [Gordonia hirsuta]GAC56334.1 putative phosphoglucomutase [Gordonia hirsuta DSM 44140 = NBRC 16056]
MRALIDAAYLWREHDPDPVTRAELTTVIDAAQTGDAAAAAELSARFSGPLTFGTAGLRGPVGAGESRMNIAVVIRATAGLARYLLDTVGPSATVVVGCDGRRGSSEFMAAALQVLSGAGLTAVALPERLPTPVTAYAVRALDCEAGIMITASHNPPADNGFKVYLGGAASDPAGRGVQIVAPADSEIAARIAACPPADAVPRSTATITPAPAWLPAGYIARMAGHRDSAAESPVTVVLTAMHGVGGATALAVLAAAGITRVHPVPEQFDPDPRFPTVAFPNPEEPGALDRALALARRTQADVVIALDPDADRCSVAVPGPRGRWQQLTGDELGALLGEQAAADPTRPGDTLACSIVSSRLLMAIAEHHGLTGVQTLTGFKWIARTPGLRFGYEEAIGYCTDPQAVADKDGIGTAVQVITLIETLAAHGKTLLDQLDELARRHGLYASAQLSFRVADPAALSDGMARLRGALPVQLAGSPVVEYRDLADGYRGLPPTDGLLVRTAADDRVIVRPSGTEPKLKCYLECVLPVGQTIPRAAAGERLEMIKTELTAALGW